MLLLHLNHSISGHFIGQPKHPVTNPKKPQYRHDDQYRNQGRTSSRTHGFALVIDDGNTPTEGQRVPNRMCRSSSRVSNHRLRRAVLGWTYFQSVPDEPRELIYSAFCSARDTDRLSKTDALILMPAKRWDELGTHESPARESPSRPLRSAVPERRQVADKMWQHPDPHARSCLRFPECVAMHRQPRARPKSQRYPDQRQYPRDFQLGSLLA